MRISIVGSAYVTLPLTTVVRIQDPQILFYVLIFHWNFKKNKFSPAGFEPATIR